MPKAEAERRLSPRLEFRLPLRMRIAANPKSGQTESFRGETLNVSERGICFTAERSLRLGTPLEVSLTMPREITGHQATEVLCSARVVHVQPGLTPKAPPRIGAYFEQVEPAAASYWK